MTTTIPATVVARHAWATEVLTVEYHPNDHGMKYSIHVDGGKHHGVVIHCPTERSAMRLFDQIVAYRIRYDDHPFLVSHQ